MRKRKYPSKEQRERLLTKNLYRCCVCKREGIGLHLHHIDEDSSNTVDENLAVLCVQDHDLHHRPDAYNHVRHIELGSEKIKKFKTSWESFITEARQDKPKILATVSVYGNYEHIHAAQLVMQWFDENIEYERVFHLLEGDYEYWVEEIMREVDNFGKNIKIAIINEPLPVEHCPCCGKGFSRTVKEGIAIQMTDPNWSTDSNCSIYINPNQPSLALLISFRDKVIYQSNLHLCQGKYLHYSGDFYDERIELKKRSSVRTQATKIMQKVVDNWQPSKIFIGTGDHDEPLLINGFELPLCWEKRTT
ncbi:HNH endonuclease signature motif containing protein [Nostoc sp. ChiVER01]|uniref:HNH endonuclease signature motif containing protein n=1 Tax=Nostoc sp. ChiVER01 TaxID=3075382 RepID=UPI002AD29682|nr:HNH endonuclease signature motif containing protein [Nostoc sp. ChiVER01]MDZ8226608.1 HNH endonuclease signature motif containing protein [Nostoc sp. ChiVER01]